MGCHGTGAYSVTATIPVPRTLWAGSSFGATLLRVSLGMSFGLGPFRVYASSGGRRRRHRRYAPVRRRPAGRRLSRSPRFWQVLGVLFVIGFIGAYPIPSIIIAVLGIGGSLLYRQQTIRQKRMEQEHREAVERDRQARAATMSALRPEDLEWLRSQGWEQPNADPLAS